jgi:ectoine hydroxylase-related dioxygenase (phytanoyl-CoA dioxygenase family)
MELSPAEHASGTLKPETLTLAVQQVKMNGYVLFEAVLPPPLVADLHTQFMTVLEAHIARTDQNRGVNRYQMHLPFMPTFIDPHVITNPFALAVIDALLGEDCLCHYFASDTPLPGAQYQGVHSDIHPLFPESNFSVPAYTLALNIPLVDFCPDNGPIEIWPGGTHLMPAGVNVQEMAPLMHSETVLMPAGSLLIRDLRMWHRGTPNPSDAARPNMAMIYARHWMNTSYPPIGIPRATYDQLSERAQQLFRKEDIGGSLVNMP